MKLTNDLGAGQIHSTADVAPTAHTLFCGKCLKDSTFIDSRLALLCFLRLSTSVLSCLPFALR